MAKRRQIHPETWTDTKFVGLSPLARLLFIGMWNFACDNGHLDDDALQLKMRVLPADNCDVAELLEEIVGSGMVTRQGGFLKVVNLPTKQALDMRYLVFCDHCEEDAERHFHDEDKVGTQRKPKARTSGTPRAHMGDTSSARRSGDGDGDGESAPTRPDVEDVCTLLADLIESNGSKRPAITKRWRDSARLMLDADKRPLSEAKLVMRWSQGDDFWKSNVLSMPKFREKYDTLRLQAGRAETPKQASNDNYWSNW